MRENTICFLETEDQLNTLIQWQKAFKKKVLIIAVMPEVDYICQQKKFTYISIEKLADWEYLNEIGCNNNDIIENFCDIYDSVVHHYLAQLGLQIYAPFISSRANFHSIKNLYDSYLLRLIPIKRVFQVYNPEEIICFNAMTNSAPISTDFTNRDVYSLVTAIAPGVAAYFNAKIIWLNCRYGLNDEIATAVKNEHTMKKTNSMLHCIRMNYFSQILKKLKCLIDKNSKNKFIHLPLKKKVSVALGDIKQMKPNNLNNKCKYLITNITHENLADKAAFIWKEKYNGSVLNYDIFTFCRNSILWKMELIKNEIFDSIWNDIINNESIKSIFQYEGVNFFSFIEQYIKVFTYNEIGMVFVYAPVIKKRMDDAADYKIIILSGGMVLLNYVIGNICNLKNIPFLSVHYGSGSGVAMSPNHERYDMADCDYYIVNGEGARRHYINPSKKTFWRKTRKRGEPVSIGALWLDDFIYKAVRSNKEPNTKKRKRIMYVTQGLNGDNRYLSYVFTPEIWYYRFQMRLMKTLSESNDIEVLVKFPPRGRYPQIYNPLNSWLEENQFENIAIMPDSKFEDVYEQADAYMIDGPGTSLQYMAVTDRPILLYADKSIYKFNPEAAELLNKRGFFTDDEESFFRLLKQFLRKEDWSLPGPVNTEFAEQFVTHKNDGRASERLADFMYGVLEAGKS